MSDTKMKKAMMKKIIFCLLVLTGAGMLNSCQQDEVVNEAPASKGVTIRASLPNDAQSRVMLGETEGNTTKVCWEEGDEIKVKIGETEYTFTTTDSGTTTATFTCNELKEDDLILAGDYTFTYGEEPIVGKAQVNAKNSVNRYHYMTATCEVKEGNTWNDVNLKFSTQVALVKFTSLQNGSKVWLYDADSNTCLAYTNKYVDGGEVYFAIPQGIYNGRVYVETSNHELFITNLGSGKLSAGTLYCIGLNIQSGSGLVGKRFAQSPNYTNVYSYKDGDTMYVLGSGIIRKRDSILDAPKYIIILDGITDIGYQAFQQFTGLTNVIIPASVLRIDENAFQQCGGLKCLTIINNRPPALNSKAFYQNGDPETIKVPSGSVNTYKSASGWSDYKDIIQAIQ